MNTRRVSILSNNIFWTASLHCKRALFWWPPSETVLRCIITVFFHDIWTEKCHSNINVCNSIRKSIEKREKFTYNRYMSIYFAYSYISRYESWNQFITGIGLTKSRSISMNVHRLYNSQRQLVLCERQLFNASLKRFMNNIIHFFLLRNNERSISTTSLEL